MDYALGQLGTRQFEHMTQALLYAMFGTRATAYGDGSDGGRDGSFKGLVASPELGETSWNGYVVTQAKFRERTGTPDQDASWFIAQLRAELAAWKPSRNGRHRGNEKPAYMLFTTNATLSPAANGGMAKVKAVLDEFALDFGLKDWAVWSYADLCRILDGHAEVRRTYLGFIATGELMAELFNNLDQTRPDLASILMVHLAKDLTAGNTIRLGQVGPTGSQRIHLDDVGVDLPSRISGDDGSTLGAVARIIQHCDQTRAELVDAHASRLHFVVVGGPGQGKTTITNLVAQAYRVAMLADATDLSAPALEVLRATTLRLESQAISLPRSRRFPFHIDLASLAERISESGEVSLLRWIADEISRRGHKDVSSSALTQMLAQWPWLIILDGLDEVAALPVRDRIIRLITDFLEDGAQGSWDAVLLCTTRPQGYDGSLPGSAFRELRLEALTRKDALALSTRLIQLQVGEDADLKAEILVRIKRALDEPLTSRLMRSPLQVTIMTLLLEGEPRPPRDRHSLFEAYFQVIYNREVGKKGHLSQLLDEQREHVNTIHDLVAIHLQLDAEAARDSESVMTRVDFERLITNHLRQQGYTDSQAQAMADPLTTASMERLVLLVPQGDSIGFEVRSLQEYLAARRLTTGTDDEVFARLRAAAPSAYWRNTYLLAAGRAYANRPHFRERLVNVPASIDAGESAVAAAWPGVDLAIDMLEDSLASGSPAMRKLLIDHALTALDHPPVTIPSLSSVLSDISQEDIEDNPVVPAFSRAIDSSGGRKATAVIVARELFDQIGPLAVRGRQRAQLPQREVYDVPLSCPTLDQAIKSELETLGLSVAVQPLVKAFLSRLRRIRVTPLVDGLMPGLPEPDKATMDLLADADASESVYFALVLMNHSRWQEESAIRRVLAAAVKRQPVSQEIAALCGVTLVV